MLKLVLQGLAADWDVAELARTSATSGSNARVGKWAIVLGRWRAGLTSARGLNKCGKKLP
jgi:hypothetical protein